MEMAGFIFNLVKIKYYITLKDIIVYYESNFKYIFNTLIYLYCRQNCIYLNKSM